MDNVIHNPDWDIPYGYSWIALQLYVLCLEHNVDTSIIHPEIVNGYLKINVNGLVSTEFMLGVHSLENKAIHTCQVCGMHGSYRLDVWGVYCWYHYIKIKLKRLRKKIVLNFN